jgi:hypothetical protein
MIVTENSDKITLLKEETKFLDQWCDKNSIRLDAVEKRQEDDNKVFEFLTERLNRASERYSELYESIVKIQEMKDSGIKEIAQAIRDLSKPSECDVSQEWFSHEQMEIIRKHIWTNHNNDWNSIRGISPRQLKEILIKIQEIQSC